MNSQFDFGDSAGWPLMSYEVTPFAATVMSEDELSVMELDQQHWGPVLAAESTVQEQDSLTTLGWLETPRQPENSLKSPAQPFHLNAEMQLTREESLAMPPSSPSIRPRQPHAFDVRLRESTPPRRRVAGPSPPPLRQAVQVVMPLHRALMSGDLLAVQAALRDDPASAKEFVMEDACQPMVCFAAERACCSGILSELGRHGADFNTVNARGCTPLRIIAEWAIAPRQGIFWYRGDPTGPTATDDMNADERVEAEHRAVLATKVALAFGADPRLCGPDGTSAIDVAAARSATRLEELLRAVDVAHAYAALCKAAQSNRRLGSMTGSLPCTALRAIGEFLIPASQSHALQSVEILVRSAS